MRGICGRLEGRTATALISAEGLGSFPAFTGVIAVLKIASVNSCPSLVIWRCCGLPIFCTVNPSPEITGNCCNEHWTRASTYKCNSTGIASPTYAVDFGSTHSAKANRLFPPLLPPGALETVSLRGCVVSGFPPASMESAGMTNVPSFLGATA